MPSARLLPLLVMLVARPSLMSGDKYYHDAGLQCKIIPDWREVCVPDENKIKNGKNHRKVTLSGGFNTQQIMTVQDSSGRVKMGGVLEGEACLRDVKEEVEEVVAMKTTDRRLEKVAARGGKGGEKRVALLSSDADVGEAALGMDALEGETESSPSLEVDMSGPDVLTHLRTVRESILGPSGADSAGAGYQASDVTADNDRFWSRGSVPASDNLSGLTSEAPDSDKKAHASLSSVPDESMPLKNLPYEKGGLLVENPRTGRRVILAHQRRDGNPSEVVMTRAVMDESVRYLRDVVLGRDAYQEIYHECQNYHVLCSFWASTGHCDESHNYMIRDKNCLLACKRCEEHSGYLGRPVNVATVSVPKPSSQEISTPLARPRHDILLPEETPYEKGGLLVENERTGRRVVLAQQRDDGNQDEKDATGHVIEESARYLKDVVLGRDVYQGIYNDCRNKHELCSFWAGEGQCEINRNYMIRDMNCLLACKRCDEHPGYMGVEDE